MVTIEELAVISRKAELEREGYEGGITIIPESIQRDYSMNLVHFKFLLYGRAVPASALIPEVTKKNETTYIATLPRTGEVFEINIPTPKETKIEEVPIDPSINVGTAVIKTSEKLVMGEKDVIPSLVIEKVITEVKPNPDKNMLKIGAFEFARGLERLGGPPAGETLGQMIKVKETKPSTSPSNSQSVSPSIQQSTSPSLPQSVSPSILQPTSPSDLQSILPSISQPTSPSESNSQSFLPPILQPFSSTLLPLFQMKIPSNLQSTPPLILQPFSPSLLQSTPKNPYNIPLSERETTITWSTEKSLTEFEPLKVKTEPLPPEIYKGTYEAPNTFSPPPVRPFTINQGVIQPNPEYLRQPFDKRIEGISLAELAMKGTYTIFSPLEAIPAFKGASERISFTVGGAVHYLEVLPSLLLPGIIDAGKFEGLATTEEQKLYSKLGYTAEILAEIGGVGIISRGLPYVASKLIQPTLKTVSATAVTETGDVIRGIKGAETEVTYKLLGKEIKRTFLSKTEFTSKTIGDLTRISGETIVRYAPSVPDYSEALLWEIGKMADTGTRAYATAIQVDLGKVTTGLSYLTPLQKIPAGFPTGVSKVSQLYGEYGRTLAEGTKQFVEKGFVATIGKISSVKEIGSIAGTGIKTSTATIAGTQEVTKEYLTALGTDLARIYKDIIQKEVAQTIGPIIGTATIGATAITGITAAVERTAAIPFSSVTTEPVAGTMPSIKAATEQVAATTAEPITTKAKTSLSLKVTPIVTSKSASTSPSSLKTAPSTEKKVAGLEATIPSIAITEKGAMIPLTATTEKTAFGKKVGELEATIPSVAITEKTAPFTLTITGTVPPVGIPPSISVVPPNPIVFPPIIPPFDFIKGGLSPKKEEKRSIRKREYDYTPSPISIALKIKGKKPKEKIFSGFEIRPISISSSKIGRRVARASLQLLKKKKRRY